MSTAETCAICGMQDGLHRVTCVVVSCMSKSTPPPIVEWQTLHWSEKTARVKAEQERDGWTKMAADQASEIAKLQAELAEIKGRREWGVTGVGDIPLFATIREAIAFCNHRDIGYENICHRTKAGPWKAEGEK